MQLGEIQLGEMQLGVTLSAWFEAIATASVLFEAIAIVLFEAIATVLFVEISDIIPTILKYLKISIEILVPK